MNLTRDICLGRPNDLPAGRPPHNRSPEPTKCATGAAHSFDKSRTRQSRPAVRINRAPPYDTHVEKSCTRRESALSVA